MTSIPYCAKTGVALTPWSPLARGILAGSYRGGFEHGTTDRSQGVDRGRTQSLYRGERDFEIADRVIEIAEKHGHSPAQIALAWLLSKPEVYAPIVGVPCHFGQAANGLVGPVYTLDEPLPGADPTLHNILVAQAEEALSRLPARDGNADAARHATHVACAPVHHVDLVEGVAGLALALEHQQRTVAARVALARAIEALDSVVEVRAQLLDRALDPRRDLAGLLVASRLGELGAGVR